VANVLKQYGDFIMETITLTAKANVNNNKSNLRQTDYYYIVEYEIQPDEKLYTYLHLNTSMKSWQYMTLDENCKRCEAGYYR
jgi:hypothetical protein